MIVVLRKRALYGVILAVADKRESKQEDEEAHASYELLIMSWAFQE